MKPANRRALKGLLLAVGGLAVGFVIAGYVLLQRSLPPTDGSVVLAGLRNEVAVTFDSMGVPQIWAESETDALYALGYQHAADRMFQMDLVRRFSQGRLSEMLGQVTMATDKYQRMIGHARITRRALDNLSDDNRRRLQAYADGVNGYVATCRAVPFEFRLLPVDFEVWSVYDCLSILSFQTWYSDALQNRDRFHLDLAELLPPEQARELVPDYPDWAPTTLTNEPVHGFHSPANNAPTKRHNVDPAVKPATQDTTCDLAVSSTPFQRSVAATLLGAAASPLRMTDASNSWVVAPVRSATGHAMLAADPHLELGRLPQFWYAVGMHVTQPSFGVLGITVPGLPFIVMGHNGAAAWSFTAGGIDLTDYFEHKLDPDDSLSVLTPAGYEPLEIIIDTILVSDALPVELRTRLTRHGPITIDDNGKLYSLKWAGHDVDIDAAVTAGFDLSRVTSFGRFRSVVINLGALNANYMFADSAGNIGYQLSAPLPIRPRGESRFPVPGWNIEDDWLGYYPLDWTPHAYNPAQGWLASSNNRPDRSQRYNGNFAVGRIMRITDLLTTNAQVTVNDMTTWQMDRRDEYMLRWRDVLADAFDSIGDGSHASLVRAWDGQADAASLVVPMVANFMHRLKHLTFNDELGALSGQVSKLTLDRLYAAEESVWFDDVTTPDHIESRQVVAQRAALETVEAIGVGRQWGDVHTLTMRHPMAAVPIVSSILPLSYGPWPHGGSSGSLNASFYSREDDTTYSCIVGPSWRFVIDFADVDGATMVLPAGNSGNPMSPHFFDFNEMWRDGERWNVPFSRERVFERAVSTLTLLPKVGP